MSGFCWKNEEMRRFLPFLIRPFIVDSLDGWL